LFDELGRTGVTQEGYEVRGAAGVRREDGTGRVRTMGEEVRGSASELDSGTAGATGRQGQWAMVDEELRAGKDNGRR
jgi:hypothetical protein